MFCLVRPLPSHRNAFRLLPGTVGISQRDTNYYDFLNDPDTQSKIMNTVVTFWKNKIQPQWTAEASCTKLS